jgi:hypothetical protein
MSVSGYAPASTTAPAAPRPGPHRAFSVPAGGAVCAACRPGRAASPSPVALQLMSDLLSGDWDGAEAATRAPAARPAAWSPRTCSGTSSAGLRSLPAGRARVSRRSRPAARGPSGPPTPHPSGARRRAAARAGAAARRDRHGRQRPVGQGARAAAHRGPRAGRELAVRRRRGRDRARRALGVGVRLLDRELEALARTRSAS